MSTKMRFPTSEDFLIAFGIEPTEIHRAIFELNNSIAEAFVSIEPDLKLNWWILREK